MLLSFLKRELSKQASHQLAVGSSSTCELMHHEGLLCSEQAFPLPGFSAAVLKSCRRACAPSASL